MCRLQTGEESGAELLSELPGHGGLTDSLMVVDTIEEDENLPSIAVVFPVDIEVGS